MWLFLQWSKKKRKESNIVSLLGFCSILSMLSTSWLHSEKFKMNWNGNSILSENKSNLLLVWNVLSILLHYKCSGFFVRMGFPYLHQILSENGKPLAASSELNVHFQMQYPYRECIVLTPCWILTRHQGEPLCTIAITKSFLVILTKSCHRKLQGQNTLDWNRIWDWYELLFPPTNPWSGYIDIVKNIDTSGRPFNRATDIWLF